MDIDEIVLSYITSVLEESTQDPCFDVEGFIEMMSGFFPEVDFSRIAAADVCTWLFSLEAQLTALSSSSAAAAGGGPRIGSVEREISLSYLADMSLGGGGGAGDATKATAGATPPLKKERVQLLSETSDCGSTDSSTFDFFGEECDMLQEMFPDSSPLEVKQCVTIANGCMEKAIQILLYRQENDEAILCSNSSMTPKTSLKVNDTELKNRIIERYSYVDKNAEAKEYKPVVPKVEPKKMVRYLDNKVVSLRGERFTEVRRGDEDKEPTELKKPKKPICP